ncbi:MAG: hypothetical protein M3R38_33860, partial [Actinomycetota bacterium]|nr:hypothetical protein [Actinomycetota bacterium]
FLTGDARYLNYVEGAPAAKEAGRDDEQTGEEPQTRYLEEDAGAPAARPDGPPEDTADLGPYPPKVDDGAEPEREGPPNVVRRRSGGYPPRGDRGPEAPAEDYANGAQGEGAEEDFGEGHPPSRDRGGRASTSGEDFIPELPRDLFDWPEAPREFRTRGRRPPEDDDQPAGPQGPDRF